MIDLVRVLGPFPALTRLNGKHHQRSAGRITRQAVALPPLSPCTCCSSPCSRGAVSLTSGTFAAVPTPCAPGYGPYPHPQGPSCPSTTACPSSSNASADRARPWRCSWSSGQPSGWHQPLCPGARSGRARPKVRMTWMRRILSSPIGRRPLPALGESGSIKATRPDRAPPRSSRPETVPCGSSWRALQSPNRSSPTVSSCALLLREVGSVFIPGGGT